MDSKNPEPVSELIQMREPWRTLISGRFFFVFEQHGVLAVLQGGWKSYLRLCLIRDGGLKREKVKDTFKEEQQKLYSKMIVGNHEDRSRS